MRGYLFKDHAHMRRVFDGPIGQLALAINAGSAASAVEMLGARADGPIAMRVVPSAGAVLGIAIDGRDGAPGGYRAYLEQLSRRPASGEAFDECGAYVNVRMRGASAA